MLFNSLIFMLYLPVVFLIYWRLNNHLRLQNFFVIFASYIFYGWWDWRFLILIAVTTLTSYITGICISGGGRRKLWLSYNIVFNLLILAIFKYYNFFVNNLTDMLRPVGIFIDNVTMDLILPVGISFYTFQALSYTIDVYRGKIEASKDPVAFFAFISFFPQLVAGPIERATNLLPQFNHARSFDYSKAVDGCRQILWGLFKKMVVADNCARFANEIFANYTELGGINLWLGAFFFTFQIYGDFSGYSDIAIGTAKLFGINLMRNFNVPYFSRNIGEFWRRWHISLNSWFVDYVYIPMGGSRCRKVMTVRNVLVVFLLSGFWHGANWTFIAWGLYNGILFIPYILSGTNRKYIDTVATGRLFPTMSESTMMATTFLFVLVGWVIFRADNIHIAVSYIARMFSDWRLTSFHPPFLTFVWIGLMLSIEWIMRHRIHPFFIRRDGILRYRTVRWTVYLIFVFLCLVKSGQQNDFIYFQF